MSKYIAWIDVESTGLDPVKCDVVQIALLIEENSEIVEEANIKLRPYVNCLVEDAALQVIDKTREEITPSLWVQLSLRSRSRARIPPKVEASIGNWKERNKTSKPLYPWVKIGSILSGTSLVSQH